MQGNCKKCLPLNPHAIPYAAPQFMIHAKTNKYNLAAVTPMQIQIPTGLLSQPSLPGHPPFNCPTSATPKMLASYMSLISHDICGPDTIHHPRMQMIHIKALNSTNVMLQTQINQRQNTCANKMLKLHHSKTGGSDSTRPTY